MASKALFGVSQSSLLLQQPKLGLSQGRTTVCLISVRSPTIASFSSGLRASNRTNLRAAIISDAKSSDSFTVDSATKKNDVELDSGGGSGGGFSGNEGGGGGGGGGGDDNNRGDGDGESHEEGGEPKKMAMSMSQKLTLGYAALVGGKSKFYGALINLTFIEGFRSTDLIGKHQLRIDLVDSL